MAKISTPEPLTLTLPVDLANEAHRIAAEERWSVEDAVLFLIKAGCVSQKQAEQSLESGYQRFMANPQDRQAGDALISCVFGPEAIGKD